MELAGNGVKRFQLIVGIDSIGSRRDHKHAVAAGATTMLTTTKVT